jgi:outer membrane protein OmpA-like peptidoglycan-associated protein
MSFLIRSGKPKQNGINNLACLPGSLIILSSFLWFQVYQLSAQNFSSMKIVIQNAGSEINSPFADFAPVISADGLTLIFTSRRPVTEQELKRNKTAKERIFISHYDAQSGRWSKAVPMGKSINAEGRNNSAIALSGDGQRLLLFRDDDKGNGDLYESELRGTEWSEARKLPFPINSPFHESSATLSPFGNILYFVSNRKGGTGGRDIWIAFQSADGSWNKVTNAGNVLNTALDEEGIFLHADGQTLYFSSKGHNSRGGYDIFRSVYAGGKWSVPEPLPDPLNTTGNDIFFVLDASATRGYYASSRQGGWGEEDIYLISFLPSGETTLTPKLTLLKGMVYDEETRQPLEALIEITDNTENQLISTVTSNSATGKYLVSLPSGSNYGINVSARDYLFYSLNIHFPDTASYREKTVDIGLKKIKAGSTVVLNNIFFDFDKATLRPESRAELNRLAALLKEYPDMRIELSSHTDNRGSEQYNIRLSQARAQAVFDYLVSSGIEPHRLIPKGYGESTPISSNETEEGRQRNRRTEFKILHNK